MMQQYQRAKSQCGDALLLFRMGDFYELFYDDARTAAEALGLTLTSREKGENAVAMAGFPYHQLDGYLAKLIHQGFRVAICEQVEDPKKAKGLVKREVTRVVTPGTLTDEALLDPKEANYLAAVMLDPRQGAGQEPRYALAWVDLSTGRFQASAVAQSKLRDELARLQPAECLISEEDRVLHEALMRDYHVTRRPDWMFQAAQAERVLQTHFRARSMAGFGFEDPHDIRLVPAAAIIAYLQETQRTSLDHLDALIPFDESNALLIDVATRQSLELTRTIRDGERKGSLIDVLDRTVTPGGARLLAEWLSAPLRELAPIEQRLDAIEELVHAAELVERLQRELRGTYDLQRLVARIATGRASPRDLECVARTLEVLPRLKAPLTGRTSQLLRECEQGIRLCGELQVRLQQALVEGCPLVAKEGGIIRPGFHPPLDELRDLARGGKQWIARYQAEQQARLGISSLKVGYNQVFGFYIEITNAQKDKVPADYIRKQTLKNAERYITPELKEYEERVLSAEERARTLEYELFCELREAVHAVAGELRATAEALARVDVLLGLADLARRQGYCRPELHAGIETEIAEGRHPVLDALATSGTVVPNDTVAGGESGSVLIITGPNMAGKSTYIRQVALLAIMAQMGSFVPAKKARLGLADRIFARVGASDELARGLSTFMVEMTETARILNTATPRSLVILDEIGRGTSTYDGISLAWSIVEYLHDRVACRVLFATHYHELTELEKPLPGVRNWNVAVREWEGEIVFLYKIVPGAADRSYGIHVARLAGVPKEVSRRAEEILAELESDEARGGTSRKRPHTPRERPRDIQLTLFEWTDHPLLDEIRSIRIDETAPLDALRKIQTWQASLDDEKSIPSRGRPSKSS